MDKIEWKELYSSGIQLLDEGSLELLNMINNLIEIRNSSPKDKGALISALLSQMQDFAIKHFNVEENYLIKINHEDYIDHKAEHTIFKKKLAFFCFEMTNTPPKASLDEFCEFLKQWFIGHSINSRESLASVCDEETL